MYSMVMVVAMTGAPEMPQFGHKGGNGCVGYSNGCVGGHGGKFFGGHGGGKFFGGHGCAGYSTGCGGGHGGKFFGGGCGLFSCFKNKGNGCVGYGGPVMGAPVMAAPQPGCGTTVIPPAPGTVIQPGTYPPGAYAPGTVVYPPGTYPPGTVVQPGTVTTQPGTTVTPEKKAMPKADTRSDPKKLGPAPGKDN